MTNKLEEETKEYFRLLAKVHKHYKALPPIVDDDYPEMRYNLDSAVRDLIRTCKDYPCFK